MMTISADPEIRAAIARAHEERGAMIRDAFKALFKAKPAQPAVTAQPA